MKNVFKINKRIKPLVKVPDFTFVDYHNLQPSICYYVRKIDDHNNFDIMEASIVRTKNKIKNRYTLKAGTSIKVIDSFMYTYLKYRGDKNRPYNYRELLKKTLNECNMNDDFNKKRYESSAVPNDFLENPKYKKIIKDGYNLLYVVNSDEHSTIKQSYMVFVKEEKEQLINTEISYVNFKPVQIITKLKHIRGKILGNDIYNVLEFPEIHIPTSILK